MKRIFLSLVLIIMYISIGNAKPFDSGNWFSPIDGWFRKNKRPWVAHNTKFAAFSRNGREIALTLNDKAITLLQITSGTTNTILDFSLADGGVLQKPGRIAFSPNSQMVAVAFPQNKKVYIINKQKMRIIHRLKLSFIPKKIRFSARSRFLIIGDNPFQEKHRAIYDIYHRYFFYRNKKAIIGDFSRTDRYFFYCRDQKEIVWINAATRRRVRSIALAKLNGGSPVLSLRVLRDHRIVLGGKQTIHIISRYFKKKELVHYNPFLNAQGIITSPDNRFLIAGTRGKLYLFRLHENKSKLLSLPTDISHIEIYPAGHALLFTRTNSQSAHIVRLNIKTGRWR